MLRAGRARLLGPAVDRQLLLLQLQGRARVGAIHQDRRRTVRRPRNQRPRRLDADHLGLRRRLLPARTPLCDGI